MKKEKKSFYVCNGENYYFCGHKTIIAGPFDEDSFNEYKKNLKKFKSANLPQLQEFSIFENDNIREYSLYYKCDIDNLGFIPTNIDLELLNALKAAYYIDDNNVVYTSPEAIGKAMRFIKANLKPLVIESTQWPYWFEFEGNYFPSPTSSFKKYLLKYNIVDKDTLVGYSGKDLYDDKNNSNDEFLNFNLLEIL